MSKATCVPTISGGIDHIEEAEAADFFMVANPSPELVTIRELHAAFRAAENAMEGTPRGAGAARRRVEADHGHCEEAYDAAQDAFLLRTPRNGRDILEMLEVIATDNCWNTTHADDIPVRFEKFVGALRRYAATPAGMASSFAKAYFDCGPQTFAVMIEKEHPALPEIKTGDVVVVDPNKKPNTDSVVCAAVDGLGVITPYRDLPKTARLIGVATEHARKLPFEFLVNRAPDDGGTGAAKPVEMLDNWWDCEEALNVIGRAARTLRIIADACGNGAYTNTEAVEESLSLIVDTLDATCARLASLLNLPGSDANV